MTVTINIDQPFKRAIVSSVISKITNAISIQLNLEGVDLSVNIVDDEKIKSLNQQFRKINSTTDVLSFPADEKDPKTGKKYLGDVIISYPQVSRQAEENDQTTYDELTIVIAHGILHLLNYDHQSEREGEIMNSLQNSIFGIIKNAGFEKS